MSSLLIPLPHLQAERWQSHAGAQESVAAEATVVSYSYPAQPVGPSCAMLELEKSC